MKIYLNGLLLWITIACYNCCAYVGGSKSDEEVDFYKSLKDSSNEDYTKKIQGKGTRGKRATLDAVKDGVYESEVKVLGRVDDGEARDRVERASGDADFSISETPIDPSSYSQGPGSSGNKDSVTEISSVDSGPSDETTGISSKMETLKSSSTEGKDTNHDSDIGNGIEVESEEKLDDEDDEDQSTSMKTVGEVFVASRSDTMNQVLWPSGTYGLPKPLSGCPGSSGFTWNTGVRFYDTEDDGTENHNSVALHLAGDVTEDGITLEFCMKTKDVGLKSWPSGKYCVYKKGGSCPHGLKSGFVYWDDENRENKNFFDGALPEGIYTDKTKISFCCSTSGNADSAIVLPTEKPFYLFPYGSSTCQKVKNMRSSSEFVKFDEEDKGDIEKSAEGFYPYGIRPQEKDHILYMCYYEMQEEDMPLESGGIVNSEKVAHSEKIIHEFMKSNDTNDTDDIAKEQQSRTRTVKTISGIQPSTSHAIMIATGFVLTTVAILVGALLVISYFTKRWTNELKRDRKISGKLSDHREIKRQTEGRTQEEDSSTVEQIPAPQNKRPENCNETDFQETETELEDEELVEDQFLPSDSQLKSGLEFLFLKQQRRKWLARNSRNK